MHKPLTFVVVTLFGCGGELAVDHIPPYDGGAVDASAEGGGDAAQAHDSGPPKPLDCSHVASCLDGGCDAAPPQQPIALVKGQPNVTGVATDGTNVFWAANQAVGSIMECASAGCGGTPSVFGSALNPLAVAVDGASVYWLNGPSGAIMKCSASGCGAPTSVLSGLWNPWNTFGVGDGHVYFAVMGGPLQSCPESGCTAYATLAPVSALGAVTVGGANVFWRDGNGDVLACDAVSCVSPTKLASGQGGFGGIAANACAAYWTNTLTGSVMTCPSTGCANGPIALASGQSSFGPGPIAVDDSGVYWASGSGIMTCELGGCAQPRIVALPVGSATAIALDASNVYWATKGAVWKVSK